MKKLLVLVCCLIPIKCAQAENVDIGLGHDLQISGFAATSINAGDYNKAGRDLYSITDTFWRTRYQACEFDVYAYNEPYYGPPNSRRNVFDFSQALFDCTPSVNSQTHFYAGRFQNFDRGSARYFYGLADNGNTIGNYTIFRQSPMIYFAVANQDGVGVGYNFDADTSWIARYTYTDPSEATMSLKPTYSTRFDTKIAGINTEFEIARVGSFNATQAALTLWGEHKITDEVNLQAAGVLIVEQTAPETKKVWETVSGCTGKINAATQWKGGVGTIGMTNLKAPSEVSGYFFGGINRDITDRLSANAIVTQMEKISGQSQTLPSTIGMFSIAYRIR